MTTPAGAATQAHYLHLNNRYGFTPSKRAPGAAVGTPLVPAEAPPVFDPAPPTPARVFLGKTLADKLLGAINIEQFVKDEEAARARNAPLVPPLVPSADASADAAAAVTEAAPPHSGARIRLIVDRYIPKPVRTVRL
jgi:hypothetical protein